jgi:hypothetical protein
MLRFTFVKVTKNGRLKNALFISRVLGSSKISYLVTRQQQMRVKEAIAPHLLYLQGR